MQSDIDSIKEKVDSLRTNEPSNRGFFIDVLCDHINLDLDHLKRVMDRY